MFNPLKPLQNYFTSTPTTQSPIPIISNETSPNDIDIILLNFLKPLSDEASKEEKKEFYNKIEKYLGQIYDLDDILPSDEKLVKIFEKQLNGATSTDITELPKVFMEDKYLGEINSFFNLKHHRNAAVYDILRGGIARYFNLNSKKNKDELITKLKNFNQDKDLYIDFKKKYTDFINSEYYLKRFLIRVYFHQYEYATNVLEQELGLLDKNEAITFYTKYHNPPAPPPLHVNTIEEHVNGGYVKFKNKNSHKIKFKKIKRNTKRKTKRIRKQYKY